MTAVELPVLPDLELLALKLPAAWKVPGLPELPGSGTLQELDELPPPFPAF